LVEDEVVSIALFGLFREHPLALELDPLETGKYSLATARFSRCLLRLLLSLPPHWP
jgi:hypothetical protein